MYSVITGSLILREPQDVQLGKGMASATAVAILHTPSLDIHSRPRLVRWYSPPSLGAAPNLSLRVMHVLKS
jgi:hypothetical protein